MTYFVGGGAPLRATLLLSCALIGVAAKSGPALAMGGTPVPVGCVVHDGSDNVLNCSGDLSAGVPFAVVTALPAGSPPVIMNVFDVTKDISPAEVPGIALSFTGGNVVLTSDLGSKRIVTRDSLPGIYAAGSNVTINHKGDIVATGYGANGIMAMAQDCGCVDEDAFGELAAPSSTPAITEVLKIVSKADITVDSFGAGIVASGGSLVRVNSTGDIRAGYRSNGIMVIGGGVGSEAGPLGTSDVTVISTGNITLDNRGPRAGEGIDLGAFAPPFQAGIFVANGGVGSVSVQSKGDIRVDGSLRHGIFASADGPAADEAASVSVKSTGDIATNGTGSSGIYARSTYADIQIVSRGNVSSRGPFADAIHGESDFGGTVDITTSGNIDAPGDGAYGIYAAGYNDLNITINGGTVSGGSGDGGSVAFFAGANNTLVNRGTITGGMSGWAVEGDTLGSDTVENYGTISGNVELNLDPSDDWNGYVFGVQITPDVIRTDAFNNHAGATFNAGEFVELGDDGLLLNKGTLNPGGKGNITTTNLAGSLEQSRTGVLGIDINGKQADRIDVEMSDFLALFVPSVYMAGKVVPNLMSFDLSSAQQQFTIITSNGEIAVDGLSVDDTGMIDYELLYPNANEVVLSLNIDFSGTGLTPSQAALVSYLGRLLGSKGVEQFEDVFSAYLSAPNRDAVAQIANQMLSGAGNSALTAMFAGEAFGNAMRSCAVAGGGYPQLQETSCIWAKPFAREFSQSAGVDRAGIESNSAGFAGGMQAQISEKVFMGGAFSIEQTNAAIDVSSRQDGTWWQFGGILKYVEGPLKLSASVSGGQGDLDMTRQAGIAPGLTAESGTDVTFVTNLARIGYSFGETGFYVTPMLDGGATYVEMGGFTENGAGLFNLAVSSSDQWILFGGPAIEVGATIAQGGFEFRPYIKAGVTLLSEDSFDVEARLAAASSAVAPFRTTSNFDDRFATLDAGVQLFSTDGLNLRLNYQGKFGDDSHESGVDAKLSVNY